MKFFSDGIVSWFYLTMQWAIFVNSLFGYFFLRGTHFWSLRGRKKSTIPALLRPISLQADDLRRSTQPLPWPVVPWAMFPILPGLEIKQCCSKASLLLRHGNFLNLHVLMHILQQKYEEGIGDR